MKRVITLAAVCAIWLSGGSALAQSKAKAQNVPEIPYDSVPNFFKLPPNIYFGEGHRRRDQFQGARLRLHAQRRDAAVRVRSERRVRSRNRSGSLRFRLRARRARRQGRQHLGRRRRVEHGHQVQPAGPSRHDDRPAAGSGRRADQCHRSGLPRRSRTSRTRSIVRPTSAGTRRATSSSPTATAITAS